MIPFNRPTVCASEQAYVGQVLASGHVAGDGPFTKQCQALLDSALGGRAFLTTSCTDALELAALLLDIRAGDEVIVPSFTFVSSINAFVLRGATPVFVDVRPDTLNLDERLLEAAITPRTRAIVPVHYAGVGCEMDVIGALAAARGIAVVEDNAHGLFGSWRGRPLGSFGRLATQSFHGTKNFSCGEGGALIVNDPALVERAEIIREKGTDRSKFFRGEVDKYGWVDVGSSFLPADILAAVLQAQLEERARIQAARARIWNSYATGLAGWAERSGATLPTVPAHCEQTFHMFYLLARSLDDRQKLVAHLRECGVGSASHYLPLHLSPMGRKLGGRAGQCPVTESISDRLLRLPMFADLSEQQLATVVAAVTTASL